MNLVQITALRQGRTRTRRMRGISVDMGDGSHYVVRKLLTEPEGNAKLAKCSRTGWRNVGLAFAPHKSAGMGNLCPLASAGCVGGCNHESRKSHGCPRRAEQSQSHHRPVRSVAVQPDIPEGDAVADKRTFGQRDALSAGSHENRPRNPRPAKRRA
jgi:hypothetical protein